ncbi:hypothetical protein ACOMHN_047412 [Nucella lapillus]
MPVEMHHVPLEAVAFLGAVVAFLLLLVLFSLYLNKLVCFSSCGGFPCIDKPPKKDSSALGKTLMMMIICSRERSGG